MNNIRAAREMRGVKQKDLAEAMKTAYSTMSLYEKGEREPSISMLCKMAQYLNVTVGYLVGAEPYPTEPKEKKPIADSNELDERLIRALVSLHPDDTQRVLDFVAGIQVNRRE